MLYKPMKKMALLLIFLLATATTVYAAAVNVPGDVKDKSYESAVTSLAEKGIITGDADGNFHPDSTLTRAQACVIIVKSMNPPISEVAGTATQPVPQSGFKDMGGYRWVEGYVSYAVKNNIVKGYADDSFKPGNKVTVNELLTMVLRAAGYNDQNLGGTWPGNYLDKAKELNLLNGLPEQLPVYATKWMAAQLDYNALDKIVAANPQPKTPGQGTDKDKADAIPDTTAMTYANGSFNSAMTTYDGKSISYGVKVYAYGAAKDYSSTMAFSKNISDYRLDTIYKYKSTKTPAFYQMTDGKITALVLPMDVGFSGTAYSVINNTIETLNSNNDSVTGLVALTATKEITWLGKKGLTNIPVSAQYLNGELYEFNLSGGEIQSIHKASDANKEGVVFNEISSTGSGFVTVESFSNGVVKISQTDGGAMFQVEENASVYVIDNNYPLKYKAGSSGSIRSGVKIRAYDISDNKVGNADIVVIKN